MATAGGGFLLDTAGHGDTNPTCPTAPAVFLFGLDPVSPIWIRDKSLQSCAHESARNTPVVATKTSKLWEPTKNPRIVGCR